MKAIGQLNEGGYHDSSVVSLIINFEEAEFEISYENGGKLSFLKFLNISKLHLGELPMEEIKGELEFYSADFSTLSNQNIARFVFLTGPGRPSWEVDFFFKEFEKL